MSTPFKHTHVAPNEARERAAVAWWLKHNKPHLHLHDFSKAFDRIIEGRGEDLLAAVAEYDRQLVTQDRDGMSADDTEAPLDSLIIVDPAVTKLRAKVRDARASAEQAGQILIPWGKCPKCDTSLRGQGGLRCYTCKPAGDPKKFEEKAPPRSKKQPKAEAEAKPESEPELATTINGKTFGETWEALKPMDLATPEITPIEAELAKLGFDELRDVISGANCVMFALQAVPVRLRARVLGLITEHLRAT